MGDERPYILMHYQTISQKLRKKKLLKKPNFAEASQHFENLGRVCELEDLPQYAGLCNHAAAKCQNSLGNYLDEAFLLQKSSKQFLSGHMKLLRSDSVSNEGYLTHSYALHRDCVKSLQGKQEQDKLAKDMATTAVVLQMGDALRKIGATEESFREYKTGVSLLSTASVEKTNCMERLVSLNIKLGNYSECLKLLEEMMGECESLPDTGLRQDSLRRCEILRIFLLLILQPSHQQLSPTAASALEKYAWIEAADSTSVLDLDTTLAKNNLSILDENLFLKLQSLVMACQYGETEYLTSLESDLGPHLDTEQRELLRILIDQYVSNR